MKKVRKNLCWKTVTPFFVTVLIFIPFTTYHQFINYIPILKLFDDKPRPLSVIYYAIVGTFLP